MRRQNFHHYGSIATAKKVGISLRQLYHWVDNLRVTRPKLRTFGQRKFHRFTQQDVEILRTVRRQLAHGYTLRAAIGTAKGRKGGRR